MRRAILIPTLLVLFAVLCSVLLVSAGMQPGDAAYYGVVAALGLATVCYGFTLRHGCTSEAP